MRLFPMTDRCAFCRWQPSGAIDLYCLYHWAQRHVEGAVCGCGAAAVWFLRRNPVCELHGGRFPVASPGPYPSQRGCR